MCYKNNELPKFKLNDSSDSNSNNSNKSNKSNNSENFSFSGVENFKYDLFTIEELKNNLPEDLKTENNNLNRNNLYDLDIKWNNEYIRDILKNKEKDIKTKIDSFNIIMYKLSYEDRYAILNDYKDLLDKDEDIKKYPGVILRQERKLKDVFISLIKEILNCKIKDIIKLFHTKYYVQTQLSNIPFIEGSEEYIFANLINDAYDTFIIKSTYPLKKKDGMHNESKLISNIIDAKIKKPVINRK